MQFAMRFVVKASPETRLANWATASAASSPEAEIASSVPPSAPSPRISRMLFAFARRPLARTSIAAANEAAARTNAPAGRACKATVSGRRTRVSSELWDTARLLGRRGDFREGSAGRSRDPGSDCALDERGVGENDPFRLPGSQLSERRPHREQRAPEVGEHHRAGSVDRSERLEHTTTVGAERPFGSTSGGYDRYVRAGDLRHQLGET